MENETLTLILDGIFGRVSRFSGLGEKIRQRVGPCDLWSYENSGRTDLHELGRRLADDIRQLHRPCHLITYSMGGLVARAALRHEPDLHVRKVVFLNSPHAGSQTARLLPLTACRQMRPGSAFLRELDQTAWTWPSLAVWCPGDLMVFPGTSARWERASSRLRSDIPAHLWPVYSPAIHRAIVKFLAD